MAQVVYGTPDPERRAQIDARRAQKKAEAEALIVAAREAREQAVQEAVQKRLAAKNGSR